MSQEKRCEVDIKSFIEGKYKVEFPMFAKVDVNGAKTHEVFRYVKAKSELYDDTKNKIKNVPWNFTKFLLDGNGKVVGVYEPRLALERLEGDIKKLLEQSPQTNM